KNHCYLFLPPPAPCHWVATSPYETRVRCPCCRSPSTFLPPDHTAPRCSRNWCHRIPPPPAPRHWAATSPCAARVRCPCCQSQSNSDQSLPDSAAPLPQPTATVAVPTRAASDPIPNAPHQSAAHRWLQPATGLRSSPRARPCW